MADEKKAKADIVKKLLGMIDKLRSRGPKLVRIKSMLLKMQHAKDLKNKPRVHQYTGGVFKLGPIVKTARMDPGYSITPNKDRERLRRLWAAKVAEKRS